MFPLRSHSWQDQDGRLTAELQALLPSPWNCSLDKQSFRSALRAGAGKGMQRYGDRARREAQKPKAWSKGRCLRLPDSGWFLCIRQRMAFAGKGDTEGDRPGPSPASVTVNLLKQTPQCPRSPMVCCWVSHTLSSRRLVIKYRLGKGRAAPGSVVFRLRSKGNYSPGTALKASSAPILIHLPLPFQTPRW